MSDKESVEKLLQDLKKVITFHGELGIKEYPASEELQSFLRESIAMPAAFAAGSGTTKGATPLEEKQPAGSLTDIRRQLGDCTRCSLHEKRGRILFGSGSAEATLFIIGEWPSRVDDQEGALFSGAEGELLNKMLQAIDLDLDQVYLANLLKCRSPEATPPRAEQVRACLPFLLSQLETVAPRIICTMGSLAAHTLLKTNKPLVRLRGRFHDYKGTPLIPTFHPSYLLKNPEMKKAAWVDLQMIQKKL